jgi:hypothetical protein
MRYDFMEVIERRNELRAVSPRRVPSASRQTGAVNDVARARRNRPITQLICVCAAALLVNLSACNAPMVLSGLTPQPTDPTLPQQTPKPAPTAKPARHAKKSPPKPEPTLEELVEYLRGKLLALSPSDDINDNLDVVFDPAASSLTVTQPNSRCDHFINALDANSLSWDIFDPGDTHNEREELLRLTVASMSGKTARICYDKDNRLDKSVTGNRVRFLFSMRKVEQFPGFQDDMTKAVKKLIALSGGVPEKALF